MPPSVLTAQKIFGIPTAYPAASGQPGCYFIRKYNAADKDPYQPGPGMSALAWAPELAPYGVGMTACLLNQHALTVARKYNNTGARDEELMVWTDNKKVFYNNFNNQTYQWTVAQKTTTGGDSDTPFATAFVPLGPVGSEWAVPYKPGPNDPSPTDPRQYFKFWGNYSNITSPTTTIASGMAGQTPDGVAAMQSCATNPSCDAIIFWDGPFVGSWTSVQTNPPGGTPTVAQNVPPGQSRANQGVYTKN